MKSNENIASKKYAPVKIVRFESEDQVELVKSAAERRGLSFTAFVRMACVSAARKAMAAPPDPILGREVEAVKIGEVAA
jgi:uncharacterized protein (DUF1778 family)